MTLLDCDALCLELELESIHFSLAISDANERPENHQHQLQHATATATLVKSPSSVTAKQFIEGRWNETVSWAWNQAMSVIVMAKIVPCLIW